MKTVMPNPSLPVGSVLDALDHRLLAVLQQDASLPNIELAARVHTSAPTCLRRVRRLKELGVITHQVAILNPAALGFAVTAIIEITLEHQGEDKQAAFGERIGAEPAVTQCYRVSPGPDWVLIAQLADMAGYQALAQRLFGPGTNVRNVRAYFTIARTKFETRIPTLAD